MKILVVGPKAAHTMGTLVTEEAISMGHTVLQFEDRTDSRINNPYIRKAKYLFSQLSLGLSPRREKKFFESIVRFKPDLILVISASKIQPDLIKRIKQLCNTKIVVWYPDSFGGFFDQPIIACDYDHVFVKCHTIVERLLALGKNVTYLPEACAPVYDRRVTPDPLYSCDISTAGSYYSYRIQFLNVLSDYKLNLYGICKDKYGEAKPLAGYLRQRDIYLKERAKLYSSSKLVVNTLHPTEANSMNVRLFEAVCSGTPVITEYRPALEDLFVIGKEVLAFRTYKDLKELVDYYLFHPEEAETIGHCGATRALQDHTYRNRIQKIIDTIMT